MGDWQPIETAPKDRHFLAYATPEKSEEKLLKAIFGDEHPSTGRGHIIVARLRPKQRKGRVFMSVTGHSFWATHWTDLPTPPQQGAN